MTKSKLENHKLSTFPRATLLNNGERTLSRFMLALAALMFLDGCVAHSVTLTSFTPSEEIRREILAQVKKSRGDDLIAKLETNGYKCRIVRGGL